MPLGPGEERADWGCVLLKQLLEQIARLQQGISSLRSSWESLRETERRRYEPTPTTDMHFPPKSLQVEVAKSAAHLQDKELCNS